MTVITDEKGKFKGLLGVSRDITARRQADKDILQRAALLDSAYDSIIAYDLDGKIIYANQAACDIRGFSLDEMLAMNMRQLVPADKLPGLEERHRQLLEQGELSAEAVHIRKDGSAFIVDTHLRLARPGGEKLVIAVQRDITLRKQMENQLVENEAKYRTVVENMHDVLYRTDNQGDIVLVSPSITRLLGVESVAQVIGKNLARDFYANPQDRELTLELLNAKGEIVDHEVVLRRPDGKLITVAANSHICRDAAGQPAGVEGVIRDITGRKKAEAELLNALDRLESSLESTIDAIAMMSELRDPYTAGHQRRVTQLALAIAAELGLPGDRMQPLRVAGLLHDVGKIFVPSEILSKPGRLTTLEMELVRAHAAAGYDVIAAIKFPWPIADMVVQHHERMDGSGYPAGLKGDEIMLEARILAVADVTEAMMSHRPYRPSLGMDKALAEITANRGRLYDEKAGGACIKLLTEKGFEFSD